MCRHFWEPAVVFPPDGCCGHHHQRHWQRALLLLLLCRLFLRYRLAESRRPYTGAAASLRKSRRSPPSSVFYHIPQVWHSVTRSAGIPCVRLPPPSAPSELLLLLFYVAAKPNSWRFFWPFAGFSLHPIRSRSGAVLRALPGFGSGWQPAARVVASAAAASGLLNSGSRMTSSHGKRMVTRACCVLLAGSECCKDLLCRASRIRYICDH